MDLRAGSDGWRKLLALAGLVFLPVPTLTASGLAVPIPSLVYRVAAGLAANTQQIVVDLPGLPAAEIDSREEASVGVIRLSAAELATAPSSMSADAPGSPGQAGRTGTDDGSGEGSRRGSPPESKESPVGVSEGSLADDGGSAGNAPSPAAPAEDTSAVTPQPVPPAPPPPPLPPPPPAQLPIPDPVPPPQVPDLPPQARPPTLPVQVPVHAPPGRPPRPR